MKRYIVTEEQLVQYREALEEWCRGTEKDYLKVVKTSMACRKVEFPMLDPLRFGIVTSEQIDQVIELLRDVFPLES